ncbi:phosphatase PAP2 family protein [Rhodococcus erythropolis]|uniref:phosphatase PAP2 family protein n=1 Tax=Rhodococcus erythropolis TaxID=1833 RepID=UPI002949C05C|nr:phosphatase PAP2 family protein [Rhodococcus erythropolis]MDV6272049.1 phosphatase PAP2 family protein [Rhodococcus erythropolis]
MPATVSTVRNVVTEVLTESTAAEIAVAAIVVAAALFAFGSIYRASSVRSTVLRTCGLVLALVTLSIQVYRNGWLTSFDGPVTDWMVDHRSGALDQIAVVVTDLGSPVATALLGITCGVLISWRARSAVPGLIVIGTVGGAAIASTVIKALVGRERPPTNIQVLLETGHSFPSGHVTGTAALFGIAVLVVSLDRTPAVKRLLMLLAVTVTVVVALTRLYLGAHWLTDVVAGAILATLAVTVGGAVFRFVGTHSQAESTTAAVCSAEPSALHEPQSVRY